MDRITINEQQQYEVVIGTNITKENLEKTFVNYQQIVFFIDNKVQINNELIKDHLCYQFEVSETKKNLIEYEKMIKFLLENNIQRKKSLIVAIGGGVTLDLVGYVSATYKRGIDVVYIPTTLLAMVDVAIGSKNTINIGNIKNAVGTFKSPNQVIIDLEYLKTLDKRNFNNGMAEVIKHGAIKDVTIIDQLLEDEYDLQNLITQSILVKKYFIEQDQFDYGIRQSLNFGHTLGHGLEAYFNYQQYLHGEAVAIGMNQMIDSQKLQTVCQKFNLPIKMPDVDFQKLIELMENDKKNENGKIKVVKLKSLGVVDEQLQDYSFKQANR